MQQPMWIGKREVLAAQTEQLVAHGGSDGLRDEALLDSAIAKPLNVFAYAETPDLFTLAASYTFGIARDHAFIDGNKRIAAAISLGFLYLNGFSIEASKEDAYFTFLHLADGTLTEGAMAVWFREHAVPR